MFTRNRKAASQTAELAYEPIDDAELERVVGGAAVAVPAIMRNIGRLTDDGPTEDITFVYGKL